MSILQIFLGLLAFFLAWMLIFKKPLIFRLNEFMREKVFTDQLVLFSGGRIAFLLIALGVVALFSGVDLITREQGLRPKIAFKMYEQAHDDFSKKRYDSTIVRCEQLLRSKPNDLATLDLLMRAYWAVGKKDEARDVLHRILAVNPNYSVRNSPIKKK